MIQKQAVDLPFTKGLDQKKDPWRLTFGNFESLVNSVFTKEGRLTKRNGFGPLPSLPDASTIALTTFQNNLTAIGTNLLALSSGTNQWVSKGSIRPIELSTLPLVRNSLNQDQVDTAVAPNGLVCAVYEELTNTGGQSAKYTILDSNTGQVLLQSGVGAIAGAFPQVYVMGSYFMIISIGGTGPYQVFYTAISWSTLQVVQNQVSFGTSTTVPPLTALVINNILYVAYASNSAMFIATIDINFVVTIHSILTTTDVTSVISLAYDASANLLYMTWVDTTNTELEYIILQPITLNTVKTRFPVDSITNALNITTLIINGVLTIFVEIGATPHNVTMYTVTNPGITFPTITKAINVNGIGLASKAFNYNNQAYYLAAFQTTYQPSYFLINGSTSTETAPVVIGKLAYSNGGGYLTHGIPNVSQVNSTTFAIPYLIKDLIAAVNKDTNVPSGTQTAGIYTQTGINLSSWDFATVPISSEIGGVLNLSGGILWNYDGLTAVENNFNYWPEPVTVTTSTTGGSLSAQQYYYQVIYRWTDNVGMTHRSAPSIPVTITTTGSTSSNTITFPPMWLTYKSNVAIEVYRWSAGQEIYYECTSIATPVISDPTQATQSFVDTQSDATILGNQILYTNGGVLEDIGPPAFDSIALFDTRLWGIDSEDKNLLWFSKPVIESTPVEMTDLQTYYVAPTTGAQGSTGNLKCLYPMDDKLILFKDDALYYINGSGPDITGANSQYPPSALFITSTVGSSNQRSIVLTPMGLMFQSDKGIWLLGRGLDLKYIGSNVEDLTTNATVSSALAIPETNQVRFTLDSGIILQYDYYFEQWNVFKGIPNVSSTLYNNLHTFVNSYGAVYQETPGLYQDGGNPVLMSFTTSWMNLAAFQAYQRAYFFYLIGEFLTPHTLQLQIAYDFNPSPTQTSTIRPTNLSPAFGNEGPFGQGNPFGGGTDVENWRVFLQKQRCQSFQISLQEVYDSSQGTAPGAGLTLSGLNLVVGLKKGFRPIPNSKSVG